MIVLGPEYPRKPTHPPATLKSRSAGILKKQTDKVLIPIFVINQLHIWAPDKHATTDSHMDSSLLSNST